HAGARESDLKGVFEERMAQLGTTTPAFEAVFCVVDGDGPIRRFVSDRTIADGDLVAMNAGVLVDGWEGSLARTWPVDPRPEHRLRCAQWRTEGTRARDRCRPGVRVGELRTTPGLSLQGVGLGYEGLDDADRLEPGMTLQLALESAGVLGGDALLVGDGAAHPLTAFPYAPAGEELPHPRPHRCPPDHEGAMADEAVPGAGAKVVATWRRALGRTGVVL